MIECKYYKDKLCKYFCNNFETDKCNKDFIEKQYSNTLVMQCRNYNKKEK